jgi:hypothetical protein
VTGAERPALGPVPSLSRLGKDGPLRAAEQADELLDNGDTEGALVWRQEWRG